MSGKMADTAPPVADVADALLAKLTAAGLFTPRTAPVLTLEEAMAFVKKGSVRSFYRWDRKFGPCACGQGRYSRERLERGLEREARK